jgi:hypothetical protein
MLFPTTVAGSMPKPSWLAEPNKLWPAWKLSGDALAAAKLDATLLSVKEQEDAGIDIVSDGEQSRQHFVHGFLEFVDAGVFLVLHGEQRRIELGGGELVARELPLRPQLVRLGEPGRLRQAAGDGGFKHGLLRHGRQS